VKATYKHKKRVSEQVVDLWAKFLSSLKSLSFFSAFAIFEHKFLQQYNSNSDLGTNCMRRFCCADTPSKHYRPKHAYGITQCYLRPACFEPYLLRSLHSNHPPCIYHHLLLFILSAPKGWKAELTRLRSGSRTRTSACIGGGDRMTVATRPQQTN
jgi:hypothetical protein